MVGGDPRRKMSKIGERRGGKFFGEMKIKEQRSKKTSRNFLKL